MNVRRQNSHTSCPRSNLLKKRGSHEFSYARKPHGHTLAHTITTGFSGLKMRDTSTVFPTPPGFRAPSGSYTEAGGKNNLGCKGTQHTHTLSRMKEKYNHHGLWACFSQSPQGLSQGASTSRQSAGSWALGIACTRGEKVSCCL
jgi:hypothetical protein